MCVTGERVCVTFGTALGVEHELVRERSGVFFGGAAQRRGGDGARAHLTALMPGGGSRSRSSSCACSAFIAPASMAGAALRVCVRVEARELLVFDVDADWKSVCVCFVRSECGRALEQAQLRSFIVLYCKACKAYALLSVGK